MSRNSLSVPNNVRRGDCLDMRYTNVYCGLALSRILAFYMLLKKHPLSLLVPLSCPFYPKINTEMYVSTMNATHIAKPPTNSLRSFLSAKIALNSFLFSIVVCFKLN